MSSDGQGMEEVQKVVAKRRVTGVKGVAADVFIQKYAKHLKESGQFDIPKWMEYAKSGRARELPPMDPDFMYIRAASMIRQLCMNHSVGVGRFRHIYGGSYNKGVNPSHHTMASGKVIRHCFAQLQKMNLVLAPANPSSAKGRVLTSKGQSSVAHIASQCL